MCKRCKDEGRVHARDEKQLEAQEDHRTGAKKHLPKKLRKWRVQCRGCGMQLGFVEAIEGPWSKEWRIAISKKFGAVWPYCKPCTAKRAARALA